MATLQIEILNPEARKLLDNLANLQLIKIVEDKDYKKEFAELLNNLRSADIDLSDEEIKEEVEIVRAQRYAENKGDY